MSLLYAMKSPGIFLGSWYPSPATWHSHIQTPWHKVPTSLKYVWLLSCTGSTHSLELNIWCMSKWVLDTSWSETVNSGFPVCRMVCDYFRGISALSFFMEVMRRTCHRIKSIFQVLVRQTKVIHCLRRANFQIINLNRLETLGFFKPKLNYTLGYSTWRLNLPPKRKKEREGESLILL